MQQTLVTVVVPIYNVERYLDRCVESIVSQTYRNLQIILVDDGSPDHCPQMCDDWAKKDPRIEVIHKQNAGLGMARNTGMEHATGEYICFFDSDDYLAANAIECAFSAITREHADVAVFGFASVRRDGECMHRFIPDASQRLFRGEQVQGVFLEELIAPDPRGSMERRFYMSACMMMYALEAIRNCNWRFVSEREIISEDVYSLISLFRHVSSVVIVPEVLYYYRTNEVSLSRRYQKNRYERIRHFYKECTKLCGQLEYSDRVKHRVSEPFLSFTLAAMKSEMLAPVSRSEKRKNIRAIVEDDVLQQVLIQNKNDKVSGTRRIMFFAMRNKLYWLCILLIRIKLIWSTHSGR